MRRPTEEELVHERLGDEFERALSDYDTQRRVETLIDTFLTDEMVRARSGARGVSEEAYMSGNLLGREVRAEDVARAFVDLALAEKTTAAVLTVDGGNIEAALR